MIYNMLTKFKFNGMHLDSIISSHAYAHRCLQVHTNTYIHAYITVKIVKINSGSIKTCHVNQSARMSFDTKRQAALTEVNIWDGGTSLQREALVCKRLEGVNLKQIIRPNKKLVCCGQHKTFFYLNQLH